MKTHKVVFDDYAGGYTKVAKGNSFAECIDKINKHAAKKDLVYFEPDGIFSDYLEDLGKCKFFDRINGTWVAVDPEISVT